MDKTSDYEVVATGSSPVKRNIINELNFLFLFIKNVFF